MAHKSRAQSQQKTADEISNLLVSRTICSCPLLATCALVLDPHIHLIFFLYRPSALGYPSASSDEALRGLGTELCAQVCL